MCGYVQSRGDSHTFDLIKLFTHAAQASSRGLTKDESGRRLEEAGIALVWPGSVCQRVQWHARRKKVRPTGISQSGRQKSSQLLILAGPKRGSGAGGAALCQRSYRGQGVDHKPALMWVFYCNTQFYCRYRSPKMSQTCRNFCIFYWGFMCWVKTMRSMMVEGRGGCQGEIQGPGWRSIRL